MYIHTFMVVVHVSVFIWGHESWDFLKTFGLLKRFIDQSEISDNVVHVSESNCEEVVMK